MVRESWKVPVIQVRLMLKYFLPILMQQFLFALKCPHFNVISAQGVQIC